jgi:hypothetical protein
MHLTGHFIRYANSLSALRMIISITKMAIKLFIGAATVKKIGGFREPKCPRTHLTPSNREEKGAKGLAIALNRR